MIPPTLTGITTSRLVPSMRTVSLDGRAVATVADTRDGGYDVTLWDFPRPCRDLGRFASLSEALGAIVEAVSQ